jgi:methyl acetate hydrolase
MPSLSRRQFSATALAFASPARRLFAASNSASIAETLRAGLEKRGIPCATAIVANAGSITYSGAFGKRDSASSIGVTTGSIFRIASMTKAITTAAALQLVEQGKVTLDEPVAKYLPQLAKLDVLEGFDSSGKPILRPAKTQIALKHLLTHTSGFVYPTWNATLAQYNRVIGSNAPPTAVAPLTPLLFEPGTRWHYGTSVDWAGKLVEKISGLTLEQYFQKNILQPLGMQDTSFLVAPDKFDRLVSTYRRQPDGKLKEDPRTQPAAPAEFNGGGGLFSTAADYIRFTQMILRKGRVEGQTGGKDQILSPKTVALMSENQIGAIPIEPLKSTDTTVTMDLDVGPGNKYSYGFLVNSLPELGRPAGTLRWAGVENSFYWIDPKRSICAVIMMQFFPFLDPQGAGMLTDFAKAVYA